jgi:hypothetical protein
LARFVETGLLEETIYFGREAGAELTYALISDASRKAVDVETSSRRVAVILPGDEVQRWSSTEQVGIAGEVDLGLRGSLAVLVEKDFACLDRGDEENADTFPHPHAAVHVC